MKRCPECRRDYTDQTLVFCLDDGARLVDGPNSGDELPTAVHRSADISDSDLSSTSRMTEQTAILSSQSSASSRLQLDTRAPEFRYKRIALFILILAAVLVMTAAYIYRNTAAAPGEVKQFEIAVPKGGTLSKDSAPAILFSPDGKRLVATLRLASSTLLFQRPISEADWQPISGTDGARDPFFSPDGNNLGFFARGELKKVPLTGGPSTIHSAPNARGGVWESNDNLIFTPGTDSPLFRVSANGGDSTQISTLDTSAKERSHRWPEMLPNGGALLFNVVYEVGNPLDNADIAILDLKTGKHRVLIKGAAFPRYSPTGHIIYATKSAIYAVPFDVSKMEISGPAFELQKNVYASATNGRAQFSFSKAGDMVFMERDADTKESDKENGLIWINRKGEEKPLAAPTNRYSKPKLSTDGRTLFAEIATSLVSVWSLDIQRGILTPLTQAGVSYNPAPNPNGKIVAYEAVRDGVGGVMLANTDGSDERRLTSTKQFHFPSSWTPDGNTLALTAGTDRGFTEIWMIKMDAVDSPIVFAAGNFNAAAARFSPDGKWVAYVSDESGRNEIYVRSIAPGSPKVRISIDGGIQPVWAPNGNEIFFRTSRDFLSAKVRFAPELEAEKPIVLFSRDFAEDSSGPAYETEPDYDVAKDGENFLFGRRAYESNQPVVKVILNWFATIKQSTSQTQ